MNSRRVVLINTIVILLLLIGIAVGAYYYVQSVNYVSTDNARIDGQQITITAPASGQLTGWNGEVGKVYTSGETVGTITSTPGGSHIALTFPTNGTIVQQTAVQGSFVAPGTPLARAFDMNNLWVTANIDETALNDIKIGQDVDVYVDAYPGTVLTGKVSKIGLTTAATFSLLPQSNTTANYTKVTQVIPVTITLDSYKGVSLAPGMSTTVRIHK
jgi:multidrug resistance efflux pump